MYCSLDPMTLVHPQVTPPWPHTESSGPTADQTNARLSADQFTGRWIKTTVCSQADGNTYMTAINYKTFTLSS